MADVFPDLRPGMNAEMAKRRSASCSSIPPACRRNVDWWAIDRTRRSLTAQRRMVVEEALAKAPAESAGNEIRILECRLRDPRRDPRGEDRQGLGGIDQKRIVQAAGDDDGRLRSAGNAGQSRSTVGTPSSRTAVEPLQFDNAALMDPAGRVHCSISDWGKFVSLYLDPEQQKPAILTAQTIRELTTPGRSELMLGDGSSPSDPGLVEERSRTPGRTRCGIAWSGRRRTAISPCFRRRTSPAWKLTRRAMKPRAQW